MAEVQDFQKIDIRVGRIIDVELLPDSKYTTHKLTVDLGNDIGRKTSGARLVRYQKEELIGKLVLCVINLPPKQIGKLKSEVLTLGVPAKDGECVLVEPGKEVPLGGRLY